MAWIHANETFLNFWLSVKSPFCKFQISNPKTIIQWTADSQQHIVVRKRMSLFNLFSLQILINYCPKENILVTFITPGLIYGLIWKIFTTSMYYSHITYITIQIDFVRNMFYTFYTQFWIRIPPRMSFPEDICTKRLI